MWEELAPERILAGRNVLEHVNAAIDRLPSGQRAVLALRGQQGLEPAEVCATWSITEGNMRAMQHRARLSICATLDGLM